MKIGTLFAPNSSRNVIKSLTTDRAEGSIDRPQTQTFCQTYRNIPDREDFIKSQSRNSFEEGNARKRLKSAKIYQGNIMVQDQLGSIAAQNNKV